MFCLERTRRGCKVAPIPNQHRTCEYSPSLLECTKVSQLRATLDINAPIAILRSESSWCIEVFASSYLYAAGMQIPSVMKAAES